MLLTSPLQRCFAWALVLIALFFTFRALQRRAEYFTQIGQPYPFWRRVQDGAAPLGMGVIGVRALLLSYGWIAPNSSVNALLVLLATLGVVGGVAASRIRRFPD